MKRRVFIQRSLWLDLKKSNHSSMEIYRFKKALLKITQTPAEKLIDSPLVKKISYQDNKNYYLYRISSRERMLFSVLKDRIIIHDIFDQEEVKKLELASYQAESD